MLWCRTYPKRDSAWAMLEMAPVKGDGSISSNHRLSGSVQPALAIDDLQVMLLCLCVPSLGQLTTFQSTTTAAAAVI